MGKEVTKFNESNKNICAPNGGILYV